MMYQGDCLVTMDQLRALERGKTYDIKIRDLDRVHPASRGRTIEITFCDISPRIEPWEVGPDTPLHTDPRVWMVNGDSTDGSNFIYSFHGWLIESIEATA